MSDSVTMEYGAGQFSTSPKFSPYDMVLLNLDENNYISSPGAKILEVTEASSMTDTTKSYAYTGSERGYTTNRWYSYSGGAWVAGSAYTPWSSTNRTNGTYTFMWTESQSKWRYQLNGSGSTYYTTEQLYSTFAIETHFAAVTGFTDAPKAGDVITVVLIKTTDSNVNEKQNVSINCSLSRSGSCLEADCPLVKPAERQAVADNLLKELYGYEYQPYQATTAHIDPAAELGDAIHAYGYYSGIYSQELTFDSMMASDIGAPCEEEVDNELEYESSTDRNYKRKFADIAAEFLIKADEISARVTKEGAGDGFSWSLVYDSWTVKKGNTEVLKVDANGLHVTGDGTFTGTIYANDGEFSGDISASTITGSSISGTTITGGSINIGENGSGGYNFSVDKNGNLTANNGTFAGSVYAKNVVWSQTNASYGTFSGGGITPSSIYGTDNGPLVEAVRQRLSWANDYNNATGQYTTNFPAYFRAGHFTTPNSYYGPSFVISNSSGYNEIHLESHYHTFTESNGTIKIGGPSLTQGSFNIADTKTYKDMVSALTVSSSRSTVTANESSDGKFYNINVVLKNAAGNQITTLGGSSGTGVWSNGYSAGAQDVKNSVYATLSNSGWEDHGSYVSITYYAKAWYGNTQLGITQSGTAKWNF